MRTARSSVTDPPTSSPIKPRGLATGGRSEATSTSTPAASDPIRTAIVQPASGDEWGAAPPLGLRRLTTPSKRRARPTIERRVRRLGYLAPSPDGFCPTAQSYSVVSRA